MALHPKMGAVEFLCDRINREPLNAWNLHPLLWQVVRIEGRSVDGRSVLKCNLITSRHRHNLRSSLHHHPSDEADVGYAVSPGQKASDAPLNPRPIKPLRTAEISFRTGPHVNHDLVLLVADDGPPPSSDQIAAN